MSTYSYFLTFSILIVTLPILIFATELRNPFCFASKPPAYQCLAIGKIESTQEKLAVINIDKKIVTVRTGDVCGDKHVVEITDNAVILRDKQNNKHIVSFTN